MCHDKRIHKTDKPTYWQALKGFLRRRKNPKKNAILVILDFGLTHLGSFLNGYPFAEMEWRLLPF